MKGPTHRSEDILNLCLKAVSSALSAYAFMSTGSKTAMKKTPSENVIQVLLADALAKSSLLIDCEVPASDAFATIPNKNLPKTPIKPPEFGKTPTGKARNLVYDIVGYTATGGAKFFIEVKASADVRKLDDEFEDKLLPTLEALRAAPHGKVVVQIAVTKAHSCRSDSELLFQQRRGEHATLAGSDTLRFRIPKSQEEIWIGFGVYKLRA
jgi:hypothetical protein